MLRRILDALRGTRPDPHPDRRSQTHSDAGEPRAGDLLSVATDDGRFGVMKLVAVDLLGVHARLYVQRFAERPTSRDLGELTLAPFAPAREEPFSIGHMPLSHQTFRGWRPELISRGSVEPEELEGYEMWREANGGYF